MFENKPDNAIVSGNSLVHLNHQKTKAMAKIMKISDKDARIDPEVQNLIIVMSTPNVGNNTKKFIDYFNKQPDIGRIILVHTENRTKPKDRNLISVLRKEFQDIASINNHNCTILFIVENSPKDYKQNFLIQSEIVREVQHSIDQNLITKSKLVIHMQADYVNAPNFETQKRKLAPMLGFHSSTIETINHVMQLIARPKNEHEKIASEYFAPLSYHTHGI